MTRTGKTLAVVTGDVTIDWNIARVRHTESTMHTWNPDDLTRACFQPGGAALLTSLVKGVEDCLQKSEGVDCHIRHVVLPRASIRPGDQRYNHSYAMWAPFEDGGSKKTAWRVQEFLGLDRTLEGAKPDVHLRKVVNDPPKSNIVIIDDAGLGFRDNRELWPKAVTTKAGHPWVLLKMARPIAQGPLWEYLLERHAERLVLVMTVNDLRRTQVQISRQVSWERTAQDLVWELTHNPTVNALTRCAHVVVSFDTAGAVLLSRQGDSEATALLLFDPYSLEGGWRFQYKGSMIGYTSCLTAGIAREIMLRESAPDLQRGIQSGIGAMRFLHVEGYANREHMPNEVKLQFPVREVAAKLCEENAVLSTTPIPDPSSTSYLSADSAPSDGSAEPWTILSQKYHGALEQIAQRIVIEGIENVLRDVPVGRFGKLVTVDRSEIEALNNISCLIREYSARPQERPLSIAVFGPPGSGKSFAVKQVANSVLPGEIASLSFNLSQLGGPDDLLDSFHQIRDVALGGRLPLVFWDEFDSDLHGKPLGWLRYFLAPMQDGEFQQGQLIHPIGRAIFVFAGGTSHTMGAFGAGLAEAERRAAKVPDFVSRLKGYLNILGPNRSTDNEDKADDPYYVVRRAILFRSMLERGTPQLIRRVGSKKAVSIDHGVLRAFLLTTNYKHGARSMESIIAMSQLSGKNAFERSSLPSEHQLDLHVDARDFSALVQSLELEGDLLGELAAAAHDVFCESLREKGYIYGETIDDKKKTHPALRPYDELSEELKEQNRSNVRDIANKLVSVGYVMMPARRSGMKQEFPTEVVEELAQMEHSRWMRLRTESGWTYGEKTDVAAKKHKCLVPWEDLTEEEKEKDRILVEGIPRILAKAGYTVIKKSS